MAPSKRAREYAHEHTTQAYWHEALATAYDAGAAAAPYAPPESHRALVLNDPLLHAAAHVEMPMLDIIAEQAKDRARLVDLVTRKAMLEPIGPIIVQRDDAGAAGLRALIRAHLVAMAIECSFCPERAEFQSRDYMLCHRHANEHHALHGVEPDRLPWAETAERLREAVDCG